MLKGLGFALGAAGLAISAPAAAGRDTVSGVLAPPCGSRWRLRVHADGRRCAAWSYAGVKTPG